MPNYYIKHKKLSFVVRRCIKCYGLKLCTVISYSWEGSMYNEDFKLTRTYEAITIYISITCKN